MNFLLSAVYKMQVYGVYIHAMVVLQESGSNFMIDKVLLLTNKQIH